MDLDPLIAERIVRDLKGIINHEINLFDTTGTIVASTDPTRIGTSHDGARLAISSRKTVSIDDDHEFKGARRGINVPVLFNDSVVAVIGITGERSEVEPFGNVIKKMTEILIRENWEQITRFNQRERLTNLANMLVSKDHDASYANYLASVLEIDLSRPRCVVIGRLRALEGMEPTQESPYGLLYARLQPMRNTFFSISEKGICLFVDADDVRELPQLLRGIAADARARLHQDACFGIGSVVDAPGLYWQSYDEASRTIDWLLFTGGKGFASFGDMDYGAILSTIPSAEAEQLDRKVFGGLTEKEIESFGEVFDSYTRNNGSIVRCGEELFLHKNTVQNRLNRLAQKTGYNPRELADYGVLSLAFLLHRYRKWHAGV